jgi:hypothetical protein
VKPILRKNEDDANAPLILSVEFIRNRVIGLIQRPISTVEDLERFFASWWCRHYNKPYKCEEIKCYSLEELIYEYYDVNYRNNPDAIAQQDRKMAEEDEEWLKKQMGDKYEAKAEQEVKLVDQRDILKAVHELAKEEAAGEFKHTF